MCIAWRVNPVLSPTNMYECTHTCTCVQGNRSNEHAHTHNQIHSTSRIQYKRKTYKTFFFHIYATHALISIAFHTLKHTHSRARIYTIRTNFHTHKCKTRAAHYIVKKPPLLLLPSSSPSPSPTSSPSPPPLLPPIATDNNLSNITHSFGQSYRLTCGECHVEREYYSNNMFIATNTLHSIPFINLIQSDLMLNQLVEIKNFIGRNKLNLIEFSLQHETKRERHAKLIVFSNSK